MVLIIQLWVWYKPRGRSFHSDVCWLSFLLVNPALVIDSGCNTSWHCWSVLPSQMLHSPSALDGSSANVSLTWPGYLAKKLLMSHKNPQVSKGCCISVVIGCQSSVLRPPIKQKMQWQLSLSLTFSWYKSKSYIKNTDVAPGLKLSIGLI